MRRPLRDLSFPYIQSIRERAAPKLRLRYEAVAGCGPGPEEGVDGDKDALPSATAAERA